MRKYNEGDLPKDKNRIKLRKEDVIVLFHTVSTKTFPDLVAIPCSHPDDY
jgi:hypothetical protein